MRRLLCAVHEQLSPLRVGMLVAGMCLCLYYLMAAVNADYEGAALMLLPGAVTTGFRVWALMPGLDSVLFVESVPFYLLRCARLYDLPFAIGAWRSSAGGLLSSSTAPSSWPGSWTPGGRADKRADRRDRGPQEHDAQHLPRPAQPSLRRQHTGSVKGRMANNNPAIGIMGIADMFLIGFVFSHGKSPFLRLWERAAALFAVAP